MLLNFQKKCCLLFFAQVIDCEKENAPENGVEKLTAETCSKDGGELLCFNSCPPEDLDYGPEKCSCGIMVYKHGKQIVGEALNDYGIFCLSARGIILTELTALVR